ncbi:MAG TPA: TIM barrel protein [Fimbriimonas sp.]|nr:TIM barrel protein [Fimbriimonas sp.]
MPINQSLSWWCFAGRELSDEQLLAGAKRIGFKAVELVAASQFQQVHDHGLEIASHPAHKDISHGLNDLREHDRIEREIKDALEQAVKYRIPNLITFSGDRRDGLADQEGLENCVVGLRRVVKAAEEAGVYLCMELLNSKVDHHGYQCDKTPWGVELCKRLDSPRITLLYDIYHMQIMEGDIIRSIRDNSPHFSHYHTAGNPGRNDMDETQELYYPPIMKAILETGYGGYVGHEFMPRGSDTLAALESAFKLCDVAG